VAGFASGGGTVSSFSVHGLGAGKVVKLMRSSSQAWGILLTLFFFMMSPRVFSSQVVLLGRVVLIALLHGRFAACLQDSWLERII